MADTHRQKLETISSFARFCAGEAEPAYPLEIFLEVSNLCNLKCVMCGQFSALNTNRFKLLKAQDRGFLDIDRNYDSLREVLDGALLVHCFGFGEPTLHPQFRSIIEKITGHGAMCDFYTNGMHLDQDLCDFLVDSKVMQVIVSFSGTTKAFYENVYIGGDFERVLGGIHRLARTKATRGSSYPVIHINSIGFRDHVARFDDFTLMMARQGANSIILNHLSVTSDIPYLHEHVSDMRPDEEGWILSRAKAVGSALGVVVNSWAYEQHIAVDQASSEARQAERRGQVSSILQAQQRSFGNNPVESFRDIARNLRASSEDAVPERVPPVSLPLGIDELAVRRRLGIARRPQSNDKEAFLCMEPFKTLYATRNGAVKPCCLADANPFLGDLGKSDAKAIWNSPAYRTVRRGITQGQYPDFCTSCHTNKTAPEYSGASLIEGYLTWNEVVFGPGLRSALAEHAPAALSLIRRSSPSQIVARNRCIDEDPVRGPRAGPSRVPQQLFSSEASPYAIFAGEIENSRAWLAHIDRCVLRSGGLLSLEGWALDGTGAYVDSIELVVDGVPSGQRPVILRREDVVAAFPQAAGADCGFQFAAPLATDAAPHCLELRIGSLGGIRTIGGGVTWKVEG